jgi:hypothetical protein
MLKPLHKATIFSTFDAANEATKALPMNTRFKIMPAYSSHFYLAHPDMATACLVRVHNETKTIGYL